MGNWIADNAQLHLTVVVYHYLNVQCAYIYYVKNFENSPKHIRIQKMVTNYFSSFWCLLLSDVVCSFLSFGTHFIVGFFSLILLFWPQLYFNVGLSHSKFQQCHCTTIPSSKLNHKLISSHFACRSNASLLVERRQSAILKVFCRTLATAIWYD